MILNAGDEFGNYQIKEHIGTGGQAEVYRAVRKQDDMTVALKIFNPKLSQDDWTRFQAEITAIRSLRGPHIIPMFAWGEENFPNPATRDHKDNNGGNKRLYLAMQYVDRKHYAHADLRAVLDKDGPLEPEVALALLWPVARALEKVHQENHVHKDVKPSNILVESDAAGLMYSRVFLADFGITQREIVSTGGGEVGFSGTLPYIAPEQLAGSTPTARADIYGLACVTFEMLTNEPPYFADLRLGDTEVIGAIKSAPTPRLTDYRKELRQVTDQQASVADQVLAKALDKNPDKRHETSVQFMEALAKAFTKQPDDVAIPIPRPPPGNPIDPTPPPPTTPHRWWQRLTENIREHKWVAIGAVLVVAAIATSVLIATRPNDWKTSEPTVDASVQLMYPAGWDQFDQPGAYSLFAESDWRGVFVHNPSPEAWERFVHGLYQDPASVVGLLALNLDESARGVLAQQQQRLTDMLPGRISWTQGEANEIEIDQKQARWFTGVLRPPDSSAALRLRAVFIQGPEHGSIVLLFFAPSPSLDEDAPTAVFGHWRDRFVEVQNSAQLE